MISIGLQWFFVKKEVMVSLKLVDCEETTSALVMVTLFIPTVERRTLMQKLSVISQKLNQIVVLLATSVRRHRRSNVNSHRAGYYFSWYMKSLLSHGDQLPSLGWLCYLQTGTSGTVIIVLFIDVSSVKHYTLPSKWLFQNMVMSPWGVSRAESSGSPIWFHTPSDLGGPISSMLELAKCWPTFGTLSGCATGLETCSIYLGIANYHYVIHIYWFFNQCTLFTYYMFLI